MTLTSPGAGNVMDYVYTSPYTGTVGGQTGVSIICDDFADDSYIGESWKATVSTVADLSSNVRWASDTSEQQDYDEAAWLAEQLSLPANSNPTTMGYISYAIWDILDPTGVTNFLTTGSYADPAVLTAAQAWVTTASQQTYYAGEFSNVLVYTAVPGTATNCNGGPCPSNSPQEFLRVTTPEASTPVLLAVDLLGFLVLVGFLRKRVARGS